MTEQPITCSAPIRDRCSVCHGRGQCEFDYSWLDYAGRYRTVNSIFIKCPHCEGTGVVDIDDPDGLVKEGEVVPPNSSVVAEKKNMCDVSRRHPICTVSPIVNCSSVCRYAYDMECRDRRNVYCINLHAIRDAIEAEKKNEGGDCPRTPIGLLVNAERKTERG